MMHFPDTSFLCALYRTQVNSSKADALMAELVGLLRVSSLLLLEFRESVRLQIRLHANDRSKGFPQNEGLQMLRDLQVDLNADILHVATALHLGVGVFLTFDANQRKLAEAEGLIVPI